MSSHQVYCRPGLPCACKDADAAVAAVLALTVTWGKSDSPIVARHAAKVIRRTIEIAQGHDENPL